MAVLRKPFEFVEIDPRKLIMPIRHHQIELWSSCKNNPCSFCSSRLGEFYPSAKDDARYECSDEEKKAIVEKAITHLFEADKSKFNSLILKGGEVFDQFDASILPSIHELLNYIFLLASNGQLQHLFLITALKYPWEGSLLKEIIEYLGSYPLKGKLNIVVGTSWDSMYRFNGDDRRRWSFNVSVLQLQGIRVHATAILTQHMIENYFKPEVQMTRRLFSGDKWDFIPAIGKGYLDHLRNFFPKREAFLSFVKELVVRDRELLDRFVYQAARRSSTIYFAAEDDLKTRDLNAGNSGMMRYEISHCGHLKDLANYSDSDHCSMCDLLVIHGAVS